MAMSMIRLRPGVNVEMTKSLNEAGYSASNLGRFRNGLFEKLGGWDAYYPFAVGGVPRALHAWLDLNETEYLAVGSTGVGTILGAISNDDLTPLTPQTLTSNFAPDFDTTNTSPNVVVDDSSIANVTNFDSVEFLTPVSVGGIILSGIYPIDLGLGTTTYRIIAADDAAATVVSGGAVPVFDTTSGSQVVLVTFEDHGLSIGGKINFPIATPLTVAGNDSFTKILLHMNGADASTTFTDSNAGGSAHTWTAAGNAQIDTAEFEFGGASGLFDGTGDWVTTPDSADFALGSGDWTVDFWFNSNAAGGTEKDLCGHGDGSTPALSSFHIYRTTGNVILATAFVGGTGFTITGTTQFTNAVNTGWHHCALVRTGNTLKMFLDGVQEGGNVAITGTVNNSATIFAIGTAGTFTAAPWQGWIDEFRLSVGVARWTTDFVPPTAQYAGGNISIAGTYAATTVPTADTFTIGIAEVPSLTTTVAMNEGLARIQYHIALGPDSTSSGYSIGTYSSGGYSTGASGSAQTGTPITATDWTLDNWGEVLLACPEGGAVYYWQPNTGFQNVRMISGNNAPAYNNGAFVSMQTQMLITYGSTDDLTLGDLGGIGLDQDPLLIKWTNNAGDFTDFEISTTSQAGSRRLSTGSKIVGGMSVANQELLWTDLGLWSMSYLGSLQAGVWGFNQIGYGCGLIGKHAVARFGSNVVWVGESNIFLLAGSGVQTLQSPVWDTLFQNLNRAYKHKVVAWANTPFNEIFVFFPRASTSATEPDYYIKVNVLSGEWDQGALARSAAIDQSIVGMPIAASPDGVIYEHEVSPDAAGQPINASFTTGYAQLSEGLEIIFVDWVLPDFIWNTAQGGSSAAIQITFYSQYYPGDTPQTHGPYTVTQASPYINTRIRGRLLSMKVESNDIGSFWRLGGIRYRGAPDGRL